MKVRHVAIGLILMFLATWGAAWAGPHDIVVVRPSGPSASEQAQAQIDRLTKQIAAKAGWNAAGASGRYFTSEDEAVAYIKAKRPGFVLGSLGFYLKYRDALGITMVNQAVVKGSTKSQYYVVAKKGTLQTLDELSGKTLGGVHLDEPQFVERNVFDGKLTFGDQVKIQPMRSLRALRRLDKGELDAVILDQKEKDSLAALTMGAGFELIFASRPISNGGFMTITANASAKDVQVFTQAAKDFCTYDEGKEICKDFDIQEFRPASDGLFAAERAKFKGK